MIARATPWGTIQTGPDFVRLYPLEQAAVIAHEQGHLHHWHPLKRLWWLVTLRAFLQTEQYFAMCEDQEFEADRYAVDRGYGEVLAAYLYRRGNLHVKLDGYPTAAQRIEAIHV